MALESGLGPSGLQVHDASPRKNSGTFVNMVTSDWIIDPEFGYVLEFSRNSEHLLLDKAIPYSRPISFVFRYQNKNTFHTKRIVADGTFNNDFFGIDVYQPNGLRITWSNGATSANDDGATSLTAGVWFHVVVIINSADTVDVYLDGQFDRTATTTGLVLPASIAEVSDDSTNNLNGFLANARVYGRALTASEIALDYQVPLAPFRLKAPDVGLVAAAPGVRRVIIIGKRQMDLQHRIPDPLGIQLSEETREAFLQGVAR